MVVHVLMHTVVPCPRMCACEQVRSYGDEEAAKRATSAFKCLQPQDIAAAVMWCLAAPDHMEVNDVVVRPTEQLI